MEKLNNTRTTKKIAFANFKGGVGKTTVAHNFIHILAFAGKKILAIDVNAQGNLTSVFGSYDLKKNSLLELLTKECKIEDVIIHLNDNIDLIPSNINLIKFGRMNIQDKELALKNVMENVNISQYDFVVFDCATALDELNISVFSIVNSVYVPLSPGKFSLDGGYILNSILEDAADMYENDVEIKGVFLNLYKNNSIGNYSYNEMHREFKDKAFNTKVRDLIDVVDTQLMDRSYLMQMKKLKVIS